MKKFIIKLAVQDEKDKRKAMKMVSALKGIDEISIDMKAQKLTIIGMVDAVSLVSKLRKFWTADILHVGPAKEPKKEEDPKKEEAKKDEAKKEEPKKEEAKKEEPKKEEEKKAAPPEPVISTIMPYRPYYPPGTIMPYRPYYPPPMNNYYYPPNHSMEENPNACVIC